MRTGIQVSQPGYVAPMHSHPYVELLFVVEGETEVWLQGQGWVRVDPTGAVMPGRIGAFERLAVPQAGVLGRAWDAVRLWIK